MFVIFLYLCCVVFQARAQDPYIGEIRQVAFYYPPRGWALCNGQILPINQNTALFSLLGTTYGGNGVTTFALPDLRGRVSIHQGQGVGLSNSYLGYVGGTETRTLSSIHLPTHNGHMDGSFSTVNASVLPGGLQSNSVCNTNNANIVTAANPCSNNCGTNVGAQQPFSIMQPYITMNFIIATQGIYPVSD